MKRNQLEDRLVSFVVSVRDLFKKSESSQLTEILIGQIMRSSISVSLNYAEAQSAESRRDFIHKMRISLKEMRETRMALRLVSASESIKDPESFTKIFNETDEIISIFVASIKTASRILEVMKEKKAFDDRRSTNNDRRV